MRQQVTVAWSANPELWKGKGWNERDKNRDADKYRDNTTKYQRHRGDWDKRRRLHSNTQLPEFASAQGQLHGRSELRA
jgi:hypothetical protein